MIKTFTKQNIKTNPLWIRLFIMTIMLLVGTSSAWAIKIYFDNTNTNWSKVYLIVGHGSYSCFNNQMSVECGNIYSVDVNDWSDETQIAFHGGDSWGCEGNSISHRYGWHNGPFTHPYGITLNNASGKVFTPAGTQSNITTGNGTKQAYNWSSVEPYTFDKNTHCCPTLTTGTVSGATTICSGEGATVSLSGNTTGSTIQWQKSTTSSTSGFANINGATSTSYTADNLTQTTYFRAAVTLPASGNCSAITQNTTVVTVTVRATPTKYDVTVGSADNKVKLSNSQTNYTYTLYKGGTTVSNSSKTGSTGTALEWTVSSAGTYTVKAKYTGSDCAETAMNGSYTYTPCPTLTTGTVSGATTICSGEGATVSLSGNTTGSTIQWQKSTTSSTSGFANINGATSTSYTADNLTQTTYFRAAVTLPASGNCSAITQNTTVVTVTVRATPTKYDVTVGSADNKVKLSNSQTNYTYTLYKGGTTVSNSSKTGSTGTALEWTVSSAGTYTVKAKYTGSACTETLMNGSYTYTPCYQSATEGTGSFSNGTITLSATFNTCGDAYIGFQWKEEGNQWCYDNSNDCYVQLGLNNKKNETATTTVTKASGKTYVFRPYIVVGNDANNWLYGTEFTVGTCTLPVINSTDADFNKNNFADFAALYVTDCSGKEITGYQWYKDGEAYVSTCNYTTKDGSEVGDAGQTNNIRPNAAGSYTCKATYKDGTSATSAPFTVTATSGTTYANFNSPIPVIMVNTGSKNFPSCPVANETASKHADEMKKKLSVDVKILHNGSIVYDRKARMAYRGSSSLNFQKKSYAFCPGDANCGDDDKGPDYVQTAKLNMLGIGEATDKDWVLYAAAADPSMLRNRMVFDTYQAMTGNWGVHSRYVELIINGEYKGVYLMMDKVTQNKKRVNVKWEADGSSKGFIVKFDKTDIADRSVDYPDGDEKTFLSKYSGKHNIGTYDTTNDQAFEIEYPEKEDIQEDGGDWYDVIDYIKGMFNSFEDALAAGDYTTVQQYIDYESWADWFILNEFTKNVDAYRASCVFTYDGTKIKANPLWDQELSFNNQSVHANIHTGDGGNKGCENVNYLLIQDDGVYSDNFAAPFWFTGTYVSGRGTYNGAATTFAGALLNDPCFVQTVKNRWEIHKQGALSKASLEALITAYETELTSAVRDREANFWSSNGYSRNTLSCPWGTNSTGYYDDTYADAKADITAWISDAAASGSTGRRAGLDAAIDDLEGTGLTISFEPMTVETTPWMPVTITVNNESGYQYTLTYTDGELDKQANVIIEKSGDTYKYHVPRPAAWDKGDEAVEDERTDIVYGLKATLQMGDDKVVCGSSNNGEAPSATATIILQDEPNENCPQ